MNRFVLAAVVLLVGSLDATRCEAGPCCESCGCRPCTKKVCRLVCEKKKVSKPDFSVKCEDFCLPGPSIKCRVPCSCSDGCRLGCYHCGKIVYKPTCGEVRTRKTLVVGKKEEEVPSYKCVVEEVCSRCGHCTNRTSFPTAEDPTTAIALTGQPGIEVLNEKGEPMQNETPVVQVSATTTAGRSFISRLFSSK